MQKKLRFYISPYFIIKYYLLRDIIKANKRFSFSGKTLDVGCGEKPYKTLFNISEYIGIDFQDYSKNKDFNAEKPDLFFDSKYLETFDLPFESNSFDNVFAFQVLEHHKEPTKFIQEISRILRKNGLTAISVPFIEGIHESPYDYQRFTKFGLKTLIEKNGLEILCLYQQGSLFSSMYFLASETLNCYASVNKFQYIVSTVLYLIFFLPSQYLCLIFDKIIDVDNVPMNYLVVAKKVN